MFLQTLIKLCDTPARDKTSITGRRPVHAETVAGMTFVPVTQTQRPELEPVGREDARILPGPPALPWPASAHSDQGDGWFSCQVLALFTVHTDT